MHELALRIQLAVETAEPRLRAIRGEAAGEKPEPARWSKKEELGHLIDSAVNNRARFSIAALEGSHTGPTYHGDGWVELAGYATMDWNQLIGLWASLNSVLARVVDNIPAGHYSAPCRIGSRSEVSLEFLVEDYIRHMQHHLDHILGGQE